MSIFFRDRHKVVIGVVHLPPLPGSPRWGGNLRFTVDHAVADARAYARGGVDAVIIENFGDAPFAKSNVGPETVAAMAVAGSAIRATVSIPIGFNVLRNDAHSALALCAACGGSFVRVNVHSGAMLTDQGIIEGDAFNTVRYRQRICPEALLFADIHVKHAVPLGDFAIEDSAHDTLDRGAADALIISGTGTGVAADIADVQRVRHACPKAKILIGSGITVENAAEFLQFADGVIVGTSLKVAGKLFNPVDFRRVAALVKKVRGRSRS
ncbi:MAG TPA: BtpA/SgcQ family protein [Verrucomicrobiae bacterium]|nr:BtpA/SgcQ family protein [Verrucomicrobiae bacterium]